MGTKDKTIHLGGYQGEITPLFNQQSFVDCLLNIFSSGFKNLICITQRKDRPVMKFSHGGKNFFIKRYFSRGVKVLIKKKFGVDSAAISWRVPAYLSSFNVKTPGNVALFHKRKSFFHFEDVFISEEVPNHITLRKFVHENIYSARLSLRNRLAFYSTFAQFLANIHRAGIYHGDFTSDNILMEEPASNQYQLYLIDLDGIRSIKWISRRRRIKNLDEIGRNFMDFNKISLMDRARVVAFYLKYYGGERRDFSTFFAAICHRTRSRIK